MAAGEARVIMDDFWNSFPPELHENVLRFVPFPELCRLRAVSPTWNHLIKHVKFAEKATYIFRTCNVFGLCRGRRTVVIARELKLGCRIPTVRHSFPLDMRFLYEGMEGRLAHWGYSKTIATHRGFVAAVWISPTADYEVEAMRVANPVTGSFVDLPPLCQKTRAAYYGPAVLLVVEEDHSAFTLYVMQKWDVEPPQTRRAIRFDSRVREWQEFPQPPSATLNPSNIVKLGCTLFALFWDKNKGARYRPRLLAFDPVRSAWTDMAVALPAGVAVLRLATALGRLFFVGFGGTGIQRGIQLLEVDVASAKCTVVASMDDEANDFEEDVYWLTVGKKRVGVRADVVAMGLGDHIVVSSVTGAMTAYDLVNSKWCAWAAGDGVESPMVRGTHATTMSLTLSPVPGAGAPAPATRRAAR